jgi:hypothetical protein
MKYQITYRPEVTPPSGKQFIESDSVYQEHGFLYFTNKDKSVEALLSSDAVISVLKVKE